ncbi:MAG: right-handed parallel beta-helix repeat-containing protein, partial [Chloroflexi bacterium]|nr:right-handed parallel beta-helix repeat-containing protein [Chloroflexota bacterium]
QSFGVYIPGSVSGVTVQNLTISGFRDGIYLVNAQGCTIRNNTIDGVTRYAVAIWPTPRSLTGNNRVIQNDIRGANTGIYLKSANGNQIRGNSIDGLSRTASTGIDIGGSSNAVTGNRILFTNLGIQSSGSNNYQRNTIRSSFTALDGSLGAFFNNNLYAYSFPFAAYKGSQALYSSPPLGGNYWEAYDALEENCLDLDLNGFC